MAGILVARRPEGILLVEAEGAARSETLGPGGVVEDDSSSDELADRADPGRRDVETSPFEARVGFAGKSTSATFDDKRLVLREDGIEALVGTSPSSSLGGE